MIVGATKHCLKSNIQKRDLHVLVGGGRGFIGNNLTKHLIDKGHKVTVISRNPTHGNVTWKDFEYRNIFQDMALSGNKVDAVVQLSGANIAEKRWTESRKKELRDSRISTTKILVDRILELPESIRPKSFVAGSAIGIYPDSMTNVYDENYSGPFDDGFGGQLVQDWEKASEALENTVTKRSVVRTSLVLGKDGGVWAKGTLPLGLAYVGKMGDGKQWYPWIHVSDLVGLMEYCAVNEISGTFNGVSPGIVTNEEYAETIRKVTGSVVLSIPEFVINLLFDSRASLILGGKKPIPSPNTEKIGFEFKFPDIESAIQDISK